MDASKMEIWDTMAEAFTNMVKSASDWITFAIDAPFARVVVFQSSHRSPVEVPKWPQAPSKVVQHIEQIYANITEES